MQNYLSLTQNKDTPYQDVLGVLYEFPNMYKNKVIEGSPFIYYQGGANGQDPQYIGMGWIGEVAQHPDNKEDGDKREWLFVANVIDYVPFATPVSFKREDGTYIEADGTRRGYWQNGVRKLLGSEYQEILHRAKLDQEVESQITDPVLPPVMSFEKGKVKKQIKRKGKRGSGTGGSSRRSPQAKVNGDRGEKCVFEYLSSSEGMEEFKVASGLRWNAQENDTPGWDIEFVNEDGLLIHVEVKSSAGPTMTGFELTQKEKQQAEKYRETYVMFLVTNVRSSNPKWDTLLDPINSDEVSVEPNRWAVTFEDSE